MTNEQINGMTAQELGARRRILIQTGGMTDTERKITKCHFYTIRAFSSTYAPGYACHNEAQVEIEEDNFIADENGARYTGTYWKPFCWDCMVKTIVNPSAIQAIRKVN